MHVFRNEHTGAAEACFDQVKDSDKIQCVLLSSVFLEMTENLSKLHLCEQSFKNLILDRKKLMVTSLLREKYNCGNNTFEFHQKLLK